MAVETLPPKAGGAGLGSGRGRILSSLRHNPLGITGGIMLVAVVLAGLLAPLLAPYSPSEVQDRKSVV